MSPARTVILIIAASSIVRILLAAAVGLCIDESYIAGVSRRFALSYFDHPPLHICLVGVWSMLIGDDRALILRLPFIALFAGSTWLMFRLTARAFGERAGLWAALTLNLAPVFTLSIGSWVLPDGPLKLFALLSIWFVARRRRGRRARAAIEIYRRIRVCRRRPISVDVAPASALARDAGAVARRTDRGAVFHAGCRLERATRLGIG